MLPTRQISQQNVPIDIDTKNTNIILTVKIISILSKSHITGNSAIVDHLYDIRVR